jgi:AcrR family transcriptional regulator
MTEKQRNIIETALRLFAEEGFNAVSTSKIAKEAGVSEGLIFRHFDNKKGLLDAIMQEGQEKIKQQLEQFEDEEDPKTIIEKALSIPFEVEEGEYYFWRLYYALKWQREQYDFSTLEPLQSALTKAFKALNYENPKMEAEIISMLIDGIATAILLRKPKNQEEIRQTLYHKYNI